MKFNLTSSQNNFFVRNFDSTFAIWNQGGMDVFNKIYSYDELNAAFNTLIKTFDNLRVRVKFCKNEPFICIDEFQPKDYPFSFFSTDTELFEAASAFVNNPIKLNDELIKCIIFQTPTKSGFLLCLHHIIIDGFSTQVMADFFDNYLNGRPHIPEKIQSYEEYIEKEEAYKNSNRYKRDKKFWEEQFSTGPICSVLSQDRVELDYSSAEKNNEISHETFIKIKNFCKANDISISAFFNTIYSIYISRKYETDKFTLGIPVLNRTTASELNTIGLYMHILPLVVDVVSDSFLQNAKRIEDSQLTLYRHQKFTQVDIKDMLKEKGNTRNSLFDVVCDYQEFNKTDNYEFIFQYSNSLSVPLEIHLQSFNGKKHNLKIRYRTAYFGENEVQEMLNSIVNIMEYAVENPNEIITKIPLYSTEEIHKALKLTYGLSKEYSVPKHSTIYSLFEAQSEKNKKKVCVAANGKNMTYGELLSIAEALDSEIRKLTENEKSIIAVIAERSVEMYSAIYGIIRGGNAYLPIDPNYPQDRIDYILENSNAKAVIAQGKFTSLAGKTKCIDMTKFIENTPTSENLPCNAEEDDTAYVIYTSGSTGNPKGAKIPHKSAVNRILWMHDKYPLGENDVILQKTPYTFDVSVWELFWWGMVGASLAASKPDEHFLPAKILEETEKNKVTHLHFVPSVFDIFLTYLENNPEEKYKFNTVKYVFLSGEALTANSISRFYNLFDYEKVTLHNLYGPTECAVDVSYYDCVPTDIDPVPIGKPIYNTQLYVVDKYMNPTPIGVVGELCIGGINVGQGYLNNPELTNEKFIDNPFHEGKIYKTGDLAYFREDGEIVFCGRMDHQIKLNGQRIELGEIEKVISDIHGVETVAVTVRNSNNKDILVAFYSGEKISIDGIKEACEIALPTYMIPSVITHIEKMPLNQSGKLDRKALVAIEIGEIENDTFEAPINDSESIICNIFKSVLGVDRVGRNSNFFDLGGTSLSMIELLSQNGFENISAADFIANPTPAKFSILIDSDSQIQTEYLELLHSSRESKKAFVVFPYAGGGAEAYAKFVESLKKANNDISVYFIRYLHSADECKKAAEEIERVLKGKQIYFYSHCVGAAVAMQILNILEQNKKCSVEHYIAGGFIPANKPSKRNIWNFTPNFMLRSILTKAGAPFDKLSKTDIAKMLNEFRSDTDFSTQYYYQKPDKISCTFSLVISKCDLFTADYKDAEQLWKNYCKNFDDLLFIEASTHYFQADNSDDLINTILKKIN